MDTNETLNQSLLALACGDSYGSHYEYEGLTGGTFNIKKLPKKPKFPNITDDTKMATILLKHYMKNKTIYPDKLSEEYRVWAREDGDGIGIHTMTVLLEGEKDKDSQGNGALMRVIPFGVELIKDGYTFEEAVKMMNIDSAITHENETIFMSNRICLDLALHGLSVLDKTEYKELLLKLKLGDTAWVVYSLYIVIEALKMKLSFIKGFKYIVSVGGDTDTNCAIYAAIKGFDNNIEEEVTIKDFIPYELAVQFQKNLE